MIVCKDTSEAIMQIKKDKRKNRKDTARCKKYREKNKDEHRKTKTQKGCNESYVQSLV